MEQDSVVIAAFNNPFEANLVKNRLEDEEIQAFVGGTAAADVLSGTGLTTVQLFVAAADLDRVTTFVASLTDEPEMATSVSPPPDSGKETEWGYCPQCGAEVSSAFLACPSCGALIAVPKVEEPLTALGPAREEEEPGRSQSDDLATRAWRSAVFGLITLPFIFHFYSFWLLLRFILEEGDVSALSWLKVSAALFFDCYIFIVPLYSLRVLVS